MATDLVKLSKFLSLVLRHKPDAIGLELDPNGWAVVDDLVHRANENGTPLTRVLVEQIVRESDKQRYALSDDRQRIRANQGHSVSIDLALEPAIPPITLYHGTATRFIDSIRKDGLHAASRQHVHLSPDVATAIAVGQRHGKPVVLEIDAATMAAAGHLFFRSANGVWLTDRVPAEFVRFPAS